MRTQNGSTIIVALIMLAIISLVAVYSLESTNIQAKMVANSLFSTLTYQECRNEQEAQLRDLNELVSQTRDVIMDTGWRNSENGPYVSPTITTQRADALPKSENIVSSWTYLRDDENAIEGYSRGAFTGYIFENNCTAIFRFSNNSQTQGISIIGFKPDHNL